ncbi:MAG TPA: VTT domain-containing protein [Gemmatimonadales bacterium]
MSLARCADVLTRHRGTPTDDLMLRVSGVLAAVALVGALLVPAIAQLAPFVLYTVWTNGPHSPVLNGGYEPALMLYGRFFPPLLIGLLGTMATVFVEWINYHLYARAGEMHAVRRVRDSQFGTRLTAWYQRMPFAVIVFCALGPVPFWMARLLSALSGYSVARHLTATALGRFPRLWFIAALGTPLAIPTSWLIGLTVGSMVFATGAWALAQWRAGRTRSTPALSSSTPTPLHPASAVSPLGSR